MTIPQSPSYPPPTAPPLSPAPQQQQQQTPQTRRLNSDWIDNYEFGSVPTDQGLDDEALARQLQNQEDEFARVRRQSQNRPQALPTREAPLAHQHPTSIYTNDTAQDEVVARKTLQEMRDQQMAFEMQKVEQQRMQSALMTQGRIRRDQVESTNQRGPGGRGPPAIEQGCSRKKYCNCFILLTMLLGGSALVFFFGDSIWDKMGGNSDYLPPFFQDKWGSGDDPESFSEWKNKGKGLELEIQNALTNDWFDYFEEAYDDWNQSPSLSLSKKMAYKPDPNCDPIRGIMTVCNNDYGKTEWTGLNEVYYENGVIVSSVAKMNEYYLSGAGNSERQYVMCHEIGHGFGLPHRDTSVNNRDLGTCLDYTNTYKNNMHPDEVDFENLENLYGLSRRRMHLKTPSKIDEDPLKTESSILLRRVLSYKKGRLLQTSEYGEIWEHHTEDNVVVVTKLLLAR